MAIGTNDQPVKYADISGLGRGQPEIFFLAGVAQLILRELAVGLGKKVLDGLDKMKDQSGNWLAKGVLPYLTDKDVEDLARDFREAHPTKNKPTDEFTTEWFKRKINDAHWVLKYIRKHPVWKLLFNSDSSFTVKKRLERLIAFRNKFRHEEAWTHLPIKQAGELADQAITDAAELFRQLKLKDHEQAVQDLRRAQSLVEAVADRLPSGLIGYRWTLEPIEFATVNDLRKAFDKGEIGILKRKRQLITVTGTFAPRLLLAPFELQQKAQKAIRARREDRKFKDEGLQQSLYKLFAEWAPSWDERVWAEEGAQRLVGQLALDPGDEGESVCVVLRDHHVERVRALLRENGWGKPGSGYLTVRLTGRLSALIDEIEDLLKAPTSDVLRAEHDFCLVVDDEDGQFLPPDETKEYPKAKYYTGYLWKCVVPSKWLKHFGNDETSLRFHNVIFVWEHTTLTDEASVKWSLKCMANKCSNLKSKYGGHDLVEKSDLIIAGTPIGRLPDLFA